jgi:signal transduction histidine kinase
MEKEIFELDELIKEVIDETKTTTSSHSLNFIECDPVEVFADRGKIASVISNLLSNAIKYSPAGRNIEIQCEAKGDQVLVSVKDEGIGVKPQDKERLFDRYYRVTNTNTTHISGFGIGLYLCAEIINYHSGKIWVESEDGKGSTFYFSLPIMN